MLIDKMEIRSEARVFEIDPGEVRAAVAGGALVLDGRAPEVYDSGHIPGSVNVPLAGGEFAARVRSAVGAATAAIVVAGSDGESLAMAWNVEREGCGPVRGILAGGVEAYAGAGFDLARQQALAAERVVDDLVLGGAMLIDTRDDADWVRGHVPGSLHVPLESVASAAPLLRRAPVVVACADGRRAATAASILRRLGHASVWRVTGAGITQLLSRRLDLGGV